MGYAMVCESPKRPLVRQERTLPEPSDHELLIEVSACGVCRTDLHVADGDLANTRYPIVPGHEIVGKVLAMGAGVEGWREGDRIGVPWLGQTCGICRYCLSGMENLCDTPRFTGHTIDGGFATHTVADARYAFALPENLDDRHAAPLLCAGLIGFRAYRMAGNAEALGLYGFGASAHILAQMAVQDGRSVYAFTRPGDTASQRFAERLGATFAGASTDAPPAELDAAIIFAPVGALLPVALTHVRKGGRVICAGIHMSDIPAFPYALLWGERIVQSVANLTRSDGTAFFERMARQPVETHVTTYALENANKALSDLAAGAFDGAVVLEAR